MKHSIFKKSAIFTLTIMLASPAIARPDVRNMTCQQAVNLVHQSGAIVLTLSQTTYSRIVRNRTFCEYDETAKWFYTPTLDVHKCRIGKKCIISDGY